ncbi:MAG: hypothetical protein V3U51_02930 [Thermoplasmata archaeon]
MVNLLAHCLSAMALQSVVNPLLGMDSLSESSFLAGAIGMLIHLDYDCHNGGRTPLLHSVLFGAVYSWFSLTLLALLYLLGPISLDHFILFFLVVPTGFCAHLITDGFTEEGVFLFPDRLGLSHWFRRKPDPENSWVNWGRHSLSRKRKNDDPLLNLGVSSVSLIALISFLALTPP